jgi:hypothetical protein
MISISTVDSFVNNILIPVTSEENKNSVKQKKQFEDKDSLLQVEVCLSVPVCNKEICYPPKVKSSRCQGLQTCQTTKIY